MPLFSLLLFSAFLVCGGCFGRLWFIAACRKRSPKLGFHIGGQGVAETFLHSTGYVCVAGEIWPAKAAQPIEKGASVTVIGAYETHLFVSPLGSSAFPNPSIATKLLRRFLKRI